MRHPILAGSAILLASLLASTPARAQATRTWVSGVGDDANPCSRTAPCKTFAGAISKTAAGGEIDALDPGGFGSVTITKSITLDGGGGQVASILSSGTIGVIVNAAGAVVVLRNLSINGAGVTLGTSGIRFLAGKSLHVEHCTIQNFSQNGIEVALTAAGGALYVRDTSISSSTNGINVKTTTGLVAATVEKSCLDDNAIGLLAGDNSRVTIGESFLAGNSTAGIQALTATGTAEVQMERCVVANNGTGVQSAAGQTVRLSEVMVAGNTTGLQGPGALVSFGNNQIVGNGAAGTAPTTVSQQ